jgi:hypothetical protein
METTDVESRKIEENERPPALFAGRCPARDQGGRSASWHGPCSLLVEHVKQDRDPRPPSKGRATLRPLPTCTDRRPRPAPPPGPPARGQPAATTTPRRGTRAPAPPPRRRPARRPPAPARASKLHARAPAGTGLAFVPRPVFHGKSRASSRKRPSDGHLRASVRKGLSLP